VVKRALGFGFRFSRRVLLLLGEFCFHDFLLMLQIEDCDEISKSDLLADVENHRGV
jgi:hypothetical protein